MPIYAQAHKSQAKPHKTTNGTSADRIASTQSMIANQFGSRSVGSVAFSKQLTQLIQT